MATPEDYDFDTSTLAKYVISTMHVQKAIKKIKSLDIKDSDFKEKLEECVIKLETVKLSADELTDTAGNFFTYADMDQSQADEIENFYKKGNYKGIKTHFDNLKGYLYDIQNINTEFKKKFEEAKLSCVKCTDTIDEQKSSAQSTTQAVGSTALGASAVVASVLAGVFTFGIGTVIGLGITSAAALGTSSVILTASVRAVHVDAKRVFQEIANDFDNINFILSNVGSSIEEIMQQLKLIEKQVDMLKKNNMFDEKDEADATFESTQFIKAFDNILKGIRKGHDIVKRHKQEESS